MGRFDVFYDFPECPFCGEPDEDWSDGLTVQVEDGTEWTATCPCCNAKYQVCASVQVMFATEER